MVRLRERSMTRLRAMVKSQVSKRGVAIVLAAAQQHTHPSLLEEVFGDLALAGEEEEIAKQAVLVELDEVVEEFGVLALEAAGRWAAFFTLALFDLFRRECDGRATHKGKDAKTRRKVSVGGALIPAKEESHRNPFECVFCEDRRGVKTALMTIVGWFGRFGEGEFHG
jgi:hypothetical protein